MSGTVADAKSKERPPKPPYYTVIFTARRKPSPGSDGEAPDPHKEYAVTAARMAHLASTMPGYLGHDSISALQPDGTVKGATISYWSDLESIKHWRMDEEHTAARKKGKAEWYMDYKIRVAKVEREWTWSSEGNKAVGGSNEMV